MHVHVQLVVGLAHEDLERIITVNIFSAYDIWRFSDSLPFSMDAHLVVYLIWRRDSTTERAKKNTSPNVIRLQ